MNGYNIASLADLIVRYGEDRVKKTWLDPFCCPLNKDVESFLKSKAILFTQQSLSQTYLV